MSKPKVFEKPSGVKDYLPDTVAKLRYIESHVLDCMLRWGYREIMTPTLEYYDTVGVASSTSDQKLFKLLDKKGTTIVLRSDVTAPIARVVSSLLKDEPLPLRLAYHSNIFRSIEEEAGKEAEFFQTGVELVGDASAEGDAEIVALAIASLKAAGVKKFKIALGHVGFLNGLLDETLGHAPETQTALKDCLLNRNYVGYRKVIKDLTVKDAAKQELEGILRLRGGQEICMQAQKLTGDPVAQAAIEHLCEVWNVLKAYEVCDHVMIDLTMIGDFSYYTGMTFEGYASELGFPVCSGGRYDNLLQQFGRPAPATGFALKTTRILEAVNEISVEMPERILIVYTPSERQEAFAHAKKVRQEERKMVETRLISEAEFLADMNTLSNGTFEYQGIPFQEIIPFIKTDMKG
jgi:ATP phosphoribosyltransferase regulatory subunit